ncbi:MAG: hypothetical protein ABI577_18690 [bacterium]
MTRSIALTPRRLILVGLLGLITAATVGFANSNSVPASNAGDGSATISGYTVSNVHYTLDTNNPTTTTSLSFTLAPALPVGGQARVSLNNGVSWLAANACSGTSSIVCTGSVAVTSLGNLRVVAAQ